MSKLSLLLTSLVAAIPGGYLTYLMVMTFLNRADQMSGTLMGLAGLTLAMSACITLTPFGIAIFTPKGEKVASAGSAQEEADVDEDLDEDLDEEAGGFGDDPIPDDFEVEDSGDFDSAETGDLETFEYDVDGDDTGGDDFDDADFDAGDDDVFAEDDDDDLGDFDMDFDDEEDH